MERDWSARDQSSDAAIEGDIEAASMFSIIAVFSMICMMAETLAWPVAWRCARLERTSATCARQIARWASCAAMKLAIERPVSETVRTDRKSGASGKRVAGGGD